MTRLVIENVSLQFKGVGSAPVRALQNVSLTLEDREFSVVVGPSGCGKTSLLRIAAGLLEPSDGEVLLNGRKVDGPGRERGMVFQSYTLFPWLRVQENIEFGLRIKGLNSDGCASIARRFIDGTGLTHFEKSYPSELSGGMRQRVALARALANDPDVLLMDEPFGALDAQTRSLMQQLLLSIWEREHKSVLFITHDVDEAIFLGDKVYVMSARPGRIKDEVQIDIPRPRSADIVTSDRFISIKRQILASIRPEAMASGL